MIIFTASFITQYTTLDYQGQGQTLLSVQSVSKAINNNPVIQDVSFQQDRFQRIAIAGETGSGKSTLLKMIGGLVQPDEGKIYFGQKRVMGPDYQLVAGEPGIAYLSQHYELRNHYRMEELLSYASTLTAKDAGDIYRICRVDNLLKRNTFQLSGGEKQRIALARLLVGSPQLLLLDEPFSNLDLIHKSILKSVIEDISGKLAITCILTSHDPMDILSWADRLIIMKEGHIVQQDIPQHVYYRPVSEYIAGLLGHYNVIGPALAGAFSLEISGSSRKTLLRPEFFTLSPDKVAGCIPAMIDNISFRGTYYELVVNAGGQPVIVTVLNNTNKVGDVVYLSIEKDKIVCVAD